MNDDLSQSGVSCVDIMGNYTHLVVGCMAFFLKPCKCVEPHKSLTISVK